MSGFILMEVVALSPSPLEQGSGPAAPIDPSSLVNGPNGDTQILAAGIPKDRIADYSIDQFNYVSTEHGIKQWNLVADKAFLYNKEKLVHSRHVRALLYDPEGKITVVTGKEAKYFMNQKDLEIYGDVKTTFPDGFELESDYLRYRPAEKHIEIPATYPVKGRGQEGNDQSIAFTSRGFDFAMAKSEIVLQENVKFMVDKTEARAAAPATPTVSSTGAPPKSSDKTTILADHCVIYRERQIAYFTMKATRPEKSRFVQIEQPTLFAKARRADLNYGDYSKLLQYMSIHEDVYIKELSDPAGAKDVSSDNLRYATGGEAVFDTKRDVIVLTEYPQVYQDSDTITGDIVLMHRDTDIVEIEHSNAFSQGTSN